MQKKYLASEPTYRREDRREAGDMGYRLAMK